MIRGCLRIHHGQIDVHAVLARLGLADALEGKRRRVVSGMADEADPGSDAGRGRAWSAGPGQGPPPGRWGGRSAPPREERCAMAVFMHAVLPGVTTDQYDALNAKLQTQPGMFDGCLSHVCVASGKGLEIFDLWESEQDMARFGDKMMPFAEEMGLPTAPERPSAVETHNYWVSGA
jgi:hypothetical protein